MSLDNIEEIANSEEFMLAFQKLEQEEIAEILHSLEMPSPTYTDSSGYSSNTSPVRQEIEDAIARLQNERAQEPGFVPDPAPHQCAVAALAAQQHAVAAQQYAAAGPVHQQYVAPPVPQEMVVQVRGPAQAYEAPQNRAPAAGPIRNRDRTRMVFTRAQTDALEARYREHPYIVRLDRIRLAERIGAPEDTVKTWFQNRRAREKQGRVAPRHEPTEELPQAAVEMPQQPQHQHHQLEHNYAQMPPQQQYQEPQYQRPLYQEPQYQRPLYQEPQYQEPPMYEEPPLYQENQQFDIPALNHPEPPAMFSLSPELFEDFNPDIFLM